MKTHPDSNYENDFPEHPIEDPELKAKKEVVIKKEEPQIDTIKLHADLA